MQPIPARGRRAGGDGPLPCSREQRVGHRCRRCWSRHPAVPIHRDAGRGDRACLAADVVAAGHLQRAQPGGVVGSDGRVARPHGQDVRPGHVPLPVGRGAARRAPARLHRHRRLRPLLPDDGPQCVARVGLRLVRPARRAVRDADRHPSAHPDRGQHRQLPPSAGPTRAGPRRAAQFLHHRRRVLQVDAVDLPADLQRVVRPGSEQGPTHRRAGGRVRVRTAQYRRRHTVGRRCRRMRART